MTKPVDTRASGVDVGGLAPAVFVFLWATGAPVAKLGMVYADPASLLALRFGLAALLLGLWCAAIRAPWPKREDIPVMVACGLLIHAVYLGGLFGSIWMGLSAGLGALIAGLSPLFVALLAGAAGWERISPRRGAGMALGFAGAALALAPKLGASVASGASAATALTPAQAPVAGLGAIALSLVASFALACGTVAQRRWLADAPLAAGSTLQYAAAALAMALCAALTPAFGAHLMLEFTPVFTLALGWQVALLSVGAVLIYYWMLRRGEASAVSSLMFLTPGAAALIAWALLGETLSALQLAGFALAMLGVALANRSA
ncbi:MAG: DMT family transporter [Pseudomonadota bacterium]